jgi:hypothetical protein
MFRILKVPYTSLLMLIPAYDIAILLPVKAPFCPPPITLGHWTHNTQLLHGGGDKMTMYYMPVLDIQSPDGGGKKWRWN